MKYKLKCRVCLKEEENMNPLFISNNRTTYAKMLKNILGFEVIKEEGYSDQICQNCTRLLVEFTGFKESFQQASEYFKNAVRNKLNVNLSVCRREGCLIAPKKEYINSSDKGTDEYKHNQDTTNHFSTSNGGCFKKSYPKIEHNTLFDSKSSLQHQSHGNNLKLINSQQKDQKSLVEKDQLISGLSIQKLDISANILAQKFCKICKQTFSSDDYDFHFEAHKLHECTICSRRFARKTDLNDHKEIHLNVCKYVCQHCGKAFKVRTALSKHRRIHTNPREEICDVCGQRFNTRDTLKTHYKLKHTKCKDFQCNLCGLAFTLKSTLEKHIERHNSNRKRIYACSLCNVSYINKYNLDRHNVTKHTELSCDVCGEQYGKRSALLMHMRKHHQQTDGS